MANSAVKSYSNPCGFTARERVVGTYGPDRKLGAWHIIGTEVYGDNKRAMLRTAGTLNSIDRRVAAKAGA